MSVIGVREAEYFSTDESRRMFDETVARARGRRMMSLCFVEDLDESRKAIEEHGLSVVATTPFELPYFSTLLEVEHREP